ncbi:MAG: L-2-amino-thiazoline-4-carboxylic acid hydrolase [Sedimentisphaerales bacterium]|nr:L-2-amino-thiazoline-4-carboxylic acid hydrolase [Sedimentisphaerales bacterium]
MAKKLSDQQKSEYLHRCYTAVDGLWFMKVEDAYGFDAALDLDEKVWKIVPKIQSRKLKELLGHKAGLEALYECFTAKLDMDGMEFTTEKDADGQGFTISVHHCHWCELLCRANREHLSAQIGDRICNAEYSTWAKEFGDNIEYELSQQLCKGDNCCMIRFMKR